MRFTGGTGTVVLASAVLVCEQKKSKKLLGRCQVVNWTVLVYFFF